MGPVQTMPRFGKYECRQHWDGGMCDVYLADDTRLHREVVLKVLKKDAFREPERYERFRREAELACRCLHDNIVHTYDFVEDHDPPYIVMEYLRGESLRSVMSRRALGDQKRILEIASELASAMEYVHGLDIIHRDIKPENIYIEQSGRLKLLDFGIARTSDSTLTDPGIAAGTLRYMSREQYLAKPEPRSDIYAFGAVVFEMLTHEFVCKGETREEVEAWILSGTADMSPLRAAGAHEDLIALLAQCLERHAAKRPASFGEVQQRLDRIRKSNYSTATLLAAAPSGLRQPSRALWRRPALWGVVGCVLLLAAVLIWRVMGRPPRSVTEVKSKSEAVAKAVAYDQLLYDRTGDMVLVEGGQALLGAERKPVEVPAFYIDKTEVSNGAYRMYCGRRPGCVPKGNEGAPADSPIVNVSFDEAKEFARWANKRLPTANEWEKAARGAKGQKLPWGDELDANRANLRSLFPESVYSHPEGESPYKALNMVGNVNEWIDQSHKPDDRAYDGLKNMSWVRKLRPPLMRDEPYAEVRGGAYDFLTDGHTMSELPSWVSDYTLLPTRVGRPAVGFRCAKDVPSQTQ